MSDGKKSPEDRLYLAAINVSRLDILLEQAKGELSEAARMYAEKVVRWNCGDCGKDLTRGEIVGVEPHCNACGKSHVVRTKL